MDECLTILRGPLGGRAVDFSGEFFKLQNAVVRPVPDPRYRSSSEAAPTPRSVAQRWIGIRVSAARFAALTSRIAELAGAAGRRVDAWRNSIVIRVYACGIRDSRRRLSGGSRAKRIAVPAGRTGSALRSVRQFERSPLEVHHGSGQARF